MEFPLNTEQKDKFAKEGHLIVREMLSLGETAELRRIIEELAASDAYPRKLHYLKPGKYTVSGNKFATHPALAAIAEHPDIVAWVESLLGHQAHLSAFVAYVRTPGDKGSRAHNDYKRWRPVGSSMNWVFAIIPLTDFNSEYGQLLLSPGSHKLHRLIDQNARILDVNKPDRDQLGPFVDPELKAGDLLLLNMFSWHEAPPVNGTRNRCGIFNKYCAVNAPPAAGHFRYNRAAHEALRDDGKQLLAVHSEKPLIETRLLIERSGSEPNFLMQRDGSGWQLPGGTRWEEDGVGWDVGACIGSMQVLAEQQLYVDIPWMSYILDYEDSCRIYGYLDTDNFVPEVSGWRWFSKAELSGLLDSDSYASRAISQWQRNDIVRGIGKSFRQSKIQYECS